MVIVGSAVSDQPRFKESPTGYVRGFDARTGELRWTFHTIPLPGEVGYDTWQDGSASYTGNANVWTMMSADPDLGYAYLPVGNATNDHYGGHRPGTNLFANSLVCVECATGERVWHYQIVHHGLWDYDPPAAPILMDITVDGEPVKAVAQITKQAFTFVLDRETGEPLDPVEQLLAHARQLANPIGIVDRRTRVVGKYRARSGFGCLTDFGVYPFQADVQGIQQGNNGFHRFGSGIVPLDYGDGFNHLDLL